MALQNSARASPTKQPGLLHEPSTVEPAAVAGDPSQPRVRVNRDASGAKVALQPDTSYKDHRVLFPSMKFQKLFILPVTAVFALLAGCSSQAPVAKKAAKPIVAVSGQTAAFEMYKTARAWNNDATILRLENLDIPEAKPEPGKYGAWKATFVSFTNRQKREFTYSVAESSAGVHKGVFPGAESGYIANTQNRIFNIIDVRVDTTEALEVAKKQKDVADFAAKHPDVPVQFVLEWNLQLTPVAAWRVYWGATLSTSQASVFISAADGKFVKKLH